MLSKYIWVLFAFFIYSLSSVFIKFASYNDFFTIKYWCFYGITVLILFIYAIIWQRVLRNINLFSAYSAKGVVIVFSLIWGVVFFGESVTVNNIVGSIIIIIGVVLVNKDEF